MNKLTSLIARYYRSPHIIYIILLILLGVVSHIQWFNPWSVLEFGDWQYRPDEHVRQMISAWNSWVPFNNFGEVNILMSGFPFRGFAWGIITRLGFSYDIATKLTLFIPVAIGCFLTPYFLGRRLFKSEHIAFALALFYGTTTYILIIQTAHLPIAIVYMLVPLLLLILDKAMDENKLWHWLLMTLLFCVGIFYEVRMMYLVGLMLAAYFVTFVFTRSVPVRYYIKPIAICVGLLIAANIFWILPTKIAAVSSIGEVASRGLFGDSLFNILQSLALMKWNWTGGLIDRTFTAQPIPVYLWIIPLLVAVGIFFADQYRKRMLFFLVITVFGLLLSKQSAEPFPFLYNWLYNNFPGFMLFREASKFYVLVAFGYFGLLGYGLVALKQRAFTIGKWRKAYGYYAGLALILLVAFINLRPAITTEMGGTFKSAQMPEDYKKVREFIRSQPEYFRTYWVPRESWWGYYDNLHPKVRSVDVLQKEWKPMLETLGTWHGYDVAKGNIAIFKQPYSAELFSSGSVKYIIVPLRDKANDDDFFGYYGDDRQYYLDALATIPFLKKVDIGTQEVAIYENTSFKPYISSIDKVYDLPETANLPKQLPLLLDQFGAHFRVLEEGQYHRDDWAGTGAFSQLFTTSSSQKLSPGKVSQEVTVGTNTQLFTDNTSRMIEYGLANNTLTIRQQQPGSLKVNGVAQTPDNPQSSRNLARITLNPNQDYFVGHQKELVPVDSKKPQRQLGAVKGPIVVYVAQKQNAITNGKFEAGLWEEKVRDCNRYDDKAELGMRRLNNNSPDGGYYVQLAANRHTACTAQRDIAVTPGATYGFSFDYQNEGGQKVSYKLTFNDDKRTIITEELPTNDEEWHGLSRKVVVPMGATSVDLEIYGYPDEDHFLNSLTRYDNFRMTPLQSFATVPAGLIEPTATPLKPGNATITYEDRRYTFANLISNPSFEEGLWEKKVGDCHDYDDAPDIGMAHHGSGSDGKRSLELQAARHIACTHPQSIAVEENSTYSFSFDYQSDNASHASYYIVFNDPARTTIEESLPIEGKNWQSYVKQFQAPWGATKADVLVYAKPGTYSTQRMNVRYDNFRLMELPAHLSTYHLVSQPPRPIVALRHIDYKIVGPTKKTATVKGASTPFYLSMSEHYDKGWRVVLADSRATGPLDSWRPLAKPRAIPSTQHVKLNGYLNGWYIDPSAFCGNSSACQKNDDGSYDMQLIIEYAPQRWFVAGTIFSAVVLLSATGYVVWKWRKERRDG